MLEVPRILATSRLVSLTGAGGVGKTRLAVRVAAGIVDEFADGVWVVDLSPLTVPDLLPQTVATTLAIREGGQRSARDVLLDALRDRRLVLVLDTCEHLIDSCASLADEILRRAPAVRILATTREALGVQGETVYRVGSLAVPDRPCTDGVPAESDATRLFVDRARAVDPNFRHTSDNADAIVRICRRLDGIPLAIELAAARVIVLSLEQIEDRLSRSVPAAHRRRPHGCGPSANARGNGGLELSAPVEYRAADSEPAVGIPGGMVARRRRIRVQQRWHRRRATCSTC